MMRYQMQYAFVAAAMLAMPAAGNPVLATPPGGGPSITLAQAQQPATPAPTSPAPAAGAPQQPSGTPTTMPGQMMERGEGKGEMGKGMGPMMGGQGHPGPMGRTPPCPPGQTMSGTPPTCK
jgi:hypothetical protein